MTGDDATLDAVAAHHGFSRAAMSALWDALRRGGGRMAQFSHPELGGMGQWSGGMLQIGAMFDHVLKARVAAACADLAAGRPVDHGGIAAPDLAGRQRLDPSVQTMTPRAGERAEWWPGGFGWPSASGAQNGLRYAYFAEARRLAVERDGHVMLYDTGRHQIFGVSQSQSHGARLTFTADDGTVDIDALRIIQA